MELDIKKIVLLLKWQFTDFFTLLHYFHIYCFDCLLWVDNMPQLIWKLPCQNISCLQFSALWIPNKKYFFNELLSIFLFFFFFRVVLRNEITGSKDINILITPFMPDCPLKILCWFKMLPDIYRFSKNFLGFYNFRKIATFWPF